MRAGVSLAIRAVFAIVLMVLFYALAAAVAAALVGLGIVILKHVTLIHNVRAMFAIGLAGLACIAAAGVIAWSMLPRFDRFTAPGPEVVEARHPRLFAEIRAIAAATRQRMPAHVYLVSDVNAFVTQRGGIMGIGSRRVMGIGLPLLRTLQVDELRAVLAHEMGHFYGGDTRLGPWIYKTRGALARTVVNLAKAGRSTDHWIGYLFAGVQAPFRWFLIGFLRVSQAISRAQEYSADAVAVRAEGKRALVEGLKKTHAASIAHTIYMRTEVIPLVVRGALPAVGEGFSRFLANDRLSKLLDESVADELAEGTSDPYDSHPPLRERIAAASALDGADRQADPRRAIDLVDDVERIEASELAEHVDRKLEPVSWDDTGKVWLASWREEVGRARAVLADVRVDALPTDPRMIYRLAARVLGEDTARQAEDNDLRQWWHGIAGAALAILLADAGFAVTTRVGEPFQLVRGELTVEPFSELQRLIAGETSPDAWLMRWIQLGLADRMLAWRDQPAR